LVHCRRLPVSVPSAAPGADVRIRTVRLPAGLSAAGLLSVTDLRR
jgi:hypothetical protein